MDVVELHMEDIVLPSWVINIYISPIICSMGHQTCNSDSIVGNIGDLIISDSNVMVTANFNTSRLPKVVHSTAIKHVVVNGDVNLTVQVIIVILVVKLNTVETHISEDGLCDLNITTVSSIQATHASLGEHAIGDQDIVSVGDSDSCGAKVAVDHPVAGGVLEYDALNVDIADFVEVHEWAQLGYDNWHAIELRIRGRDVTELGIAISYIVTDGFTSCVQQGHVVENEISPAAARWLVANGVATQRFLEHDFGQAVLLHDAIHHGIFSNARVKDEHPGLIQVRPVSGKLVLKYKSHPVLIRAFLGANVGVSYASLCLKQKILHDVVGREGGVHVGGKVDQVGAPGRDEALLPDEGLAARALGGGAFTYEVCMWMGRGYP